MLLQNRGRDAFIIVDMQNHWIACGQNYNKVKEKVRDHIRRHIELNNLLVVVEFATVGPTCKEVMDEIGSTPYLKVTKEGSAGGTELRNELRDTMELDRIRHFYFGGVNSCQCVEATAKEFADKTGRGSDVYVVKDASACSHNHSSPDFCQLAAHTLQKI